MSESYGDLSEELRSDLEELLRAGPPLTEEQQIGRASAIEDLAQRLRRGEVKKLYEARRVGKTTVARAALRRFRAAGGIDAEVNLAIHRSPGDAANELASQLAAGMTAPEAARSTLRRLAGTLTPTRHELGDDASAIIELVDGLLGDGRDPARVLINAEHHARRSLAVFLDEAHVIGSWPAADQEALGAALRGATNLGVVIASSEQRAFELLSGEAGRCSTSGTASRSRRSPMPTGALNWQSDSRALEYRFFLTRLTYCLRARAVTRTERCCSHARAR